ncbi:MAG: hypothetical protein LKF33_06735 [Prevotella sp.]|jgi:hypothetical protein|nr:hypothetical protein [Prevotella sp.]
MRSNNNNSNELKDPQLIIHKDSTSNSKATHIAPDLNKRGCSRREAKIAISKSPTLTIYYVYVQNNN